MNSTNTFAFLRLFNLSPGAPHKDIFKGLMKKDITVLVTIEDPSKPATDDEKTVRNFSASIISVEFLNNCITLHLSSSDVLFFPIKENEKTSFFSKNRTGVTFKQGINHINIQVDLL